MAPWPADEDDVLARVTACVFACTKTQCRMYVCIDAGMHCGPPPPVGPVGPREGAAAWAHVRKAGVVRP